MRHSTDTELCKSLVAKAYPAKALLATVVDSKGLSELVIERVARFIKETGYTKLAYKSDQEPAIKDVMYEAKVKIWKDMGDFHERAKAQSACQITFLHSPVGESQASGVIEHVIQRVQGQIRAIKLDIEAKSDTGAPSMAMAD